MEFEKVSSEGLQREYLLKFANGEIDEIVDRQLDELRPTVTIKGFRPGRVPTGQLKKIYGQKLSVDVLNQKVTDFVSDTVRKESIRLAATPVYNLLSKDEDDQLHVSVKMLLFPEIEPISAFNMDLQRLVVDESDLNVLVEENVSFFLHAIAEFNETASSDSIVKGSKVRFTMDAKEGEEDYSPLSDSYNLIVSAGQIVPEIEAQLLGMKAGDEKKFDLELKTVNVPAEDREKTVSVTLKVEEVFSAKPLDESDRYFKKLGFESLNHAKEVISENTKSFYTQRSKFKLRQDFLKHLITHYKFDIPEAFMKQEAYTIALEDKQKKAKSQEEATAAINDLNPTSEQFDKAKDQLTIGFVLLDHAQKNNIVVEDAEVEKYLQYHASQLGLGGNAGEYVQAARRMKSVYNNVKGTLFQDKVVDHILESLNVAERGVSRKEFTDLVTNL